MKFVYTFSLLLASIAIYSQSANIQGKLVDESGEAVIFANVALYNFADNSLAKVETTDESGIFKMRGLAPSTYNLVATFVGIPDLKQDNIVLKEDEQLDLGLLSFAPASVELTEATVTAQRAIVEIKPDRTVFNVQGTINSTGSDAIALLRKAPGVTVDNNDNISVLGRSGVLIYVDGKRLPLSGEDLSNYLQNLPADQIDRMDIISNPGAKYEAEGNAGIIDIRLKKDKSIGANGSLNSTYSIGRQDRANIGGSGNYRNKKLNVFGATGLNHGGGFMDMKFLSYQNGLLLDEINNRAHEFKSYNYRLGTDFFLAKNHTLGFLVMGGKLTAQTMHSMKYAFQNRMLQIPSTVF